MSTVPKHVLVVANETVAGKSLTEALDRRAAEGSIRVTVVCPITWPSDDSTGKASCHALPETFAITSRAGVSAVKAT